jgi:hypothetical protein
MMKTPLATIGPRIFQESRIQEAESGLAHSAFLLPYSGSWILKFLCRRGVFNGVGAWAKWKSFCIKAPVARLDLPVLLPPGGVAELPEAKV